MTTVIASTISGAGSQFFDNNGAPLAGGLLYTYAAGTTTPLATYTDSTGGTPQANPIVLDSSGRVASGGVWLVYGDSYKFVLKTSAGVTLGTWDNTPDTVQSGLITTLTTGASDIAKTVASAYHTGVAQLLTLNQWNKLAFETVLYDNGSNYSAVNSRFTAPAAGMYMITSVSSFEKTTGVLGEYITPALYKNGAVLTFGEARFIIEASMPAMYTSSSYLAKLVANDYIELWAYANGAAGAWTVDGNLNVSTWTIARIS